MPHSTRAAKVTVYSLIIYRVSKPKRLLEAAVEYYVSTYGATAAGPPAPYDVEIVVVTVALVEKHSARRESHSALPWLERRTVEPQTQRHRRQARGRITDRLHR